MNRLLLTVSLVLCVTAHGADDVPQRDNYAYGFPVTTASERGIYQVELPLEVYQSATDPQLRDVGVFNGDGEPLPRIFRRDEDDIQRTDTEHELQMLPLYSKSQQPLDDIRMLVRRGDANAEVTFDTSLLPAEGEKLTSYVVDTRAFDNALSALEFSWPADIRGFIGKIFVEGSSDLVQWTATGSGALADMQEDDSSVRQSRVTLSNQKFDYLRIRWMDMPDRWTLVAIGGITTTEIRNTNRRQLLMQAAATDDDGGRIFDAGGSVNVDRLRIVLPQRNSVVSGTLYYWSPDSKRWQQLTSGSFDNLERSEGAKSEALPISSVRAGRFKFLASKSGSDTELQLEIGWRPDTLLFLARGSSPFTLAAGNAADAHDGFPQQRFYEDRAISDIARRQGGAEPATLGQRFPLGGEFRLTVQEPVDWRNYLLWLVLAFGVAVVGYMALRLIRDMKSDAA